MVHIILNWGYYAHLHLWPVLYYQTAYIPFIFLMFLTILSELILSLWLSWLLLGVFGSSFYFISNPSPIISKCFCCCFHVLTGNSQRNWAFVNYIIGSSVVVDSDLRTVILVRMDFSSYRLTVTSIGAGVGIGHVLKSYFWASLDGWIFEWSQGCISTLVIWRRIKDF